VILIHLLMVWDSINPGCRARLRQTPRRRALA
jgi:hypothetical protein